MDASWILAAARWLLRSLAAGLRWLALWFDRQGRAVQLGLVAAVIATLWWVGLGNRAERPRPMTEVEALARVIRSEAGIEPTHYRLHVAWATRNLAAERGQSIAEMACSPCGEQGAARPVSSRFGATDADRVLAAHVLEQPAGLDPTGGASHFINPRLQDRLARRGRRGYRGRPYAVVRRRWKRVYGWEPYYRLGPTLELWGRERASRR